MHVLLIALRIMNSNKKLFCLRPARCFQRVTAKFFFNVPCTRKERCNNLLLSVVYPKRLIFYKITEIRSKFRTITIRNKLFALRGAQSDINVENTKPKIRTIIRNITGNKKSSQVIKEVRHSMKKQPFVKIRTVFPFTRVV